MFSEGSNVDGVLTFLAKLCTQDVSIILQLSHANQRLVKVLEEILEHTIDNNTLWSNGSDSILLWERVWAALKCLQHIRFVCVYTVRASLNMNASPTIMQVLKATVEMRIFL